MAQGATDHPDARGTYRLLSSTEGAGAASSANLTSPVNPPFNRQIADKLQQAADLLTQQAANPFRVAAYRRAAEAVAASEQDMRELLARDGMLGLEAIPGVGRSIAAAIAEMVRTGRWSFLERLRSGTDPDRLFRTVPGIGPKLARRFHEALGVEILEALESAAQEGRLATVPGIGRRRTALVRAALNQMLARTRPPRRTGSTEPAVDLLLDVDREYREKVREGRLPTIAPRRFNPRGEAWLPILRTERGRWHFTALFSNTARAHELGRTRDWVVVYFSANSGDEGQRTIVTETRGDLKGKRVVRGREAECRACSAGRLVATEA